MTNTRCLKKVAIGAQKQKEELIQVNDKINTEHDFPIFIFIEILIFMYQTRFKKTGNWNLEKWFSFSLKKTKHFLRAKGTLSFLKANMRIQIEQPVITRKSDEDTFYAKSQEG